VGMSFESWPRQTLPMKAIVWVEACPLKQVAAEVG